MYYVIAYGEAARSEPLRASGEAPAALLLEGALSPGNRRAGNAVVFVDIAWDCVLRRLGMEKREQDG